MPQKVLPKMTKVICTIGPACRSPKTLSGMLKAGMNVARLNMAHGTPEQHALDVKAVRDAARQTGHTVAVMADLAGPKIRVGEIRGDVVHLQGGSTFTLTTRDVMGDASRVSVSYARLNDELKRGDRVLLADGSIELKVLQISGKNVECRVIDGGPLSSHKGVNLPTASISAPPITAKDKKDMVNALKMDVDFLAFSFVRSAADVKHVLRLLKKKGSKIPVIAKIERHEALDNIESIIENAAGIMVARGDLGVETPLENIAMVQKDLIQSANAAGKTVITATQMLLSMVEEPVPTRAEATDVANAVLDGTDAVMLSEETAVGKYPVQTVDFISRIVRRAEAVIGNSTGRAPSSGGVEGALSHAAVTVAAEIDAVAIITPTTAGTTPRIISGFRAPYPIIAVSPDRKVRQHLQLTWGVTPVACESFTDTDQMLAEGERAALDSGMVRRGQLAVFITVARPPGKSSTNLLKVKPIR